MENILLVLNIILALILVLLVLMQKSEGGALGIGVSQENMMFSKTAGNFMTKATGVVATLFIICSLALTIVSRGDLTPSSSVLDQVEEDTPTIPENNNSYFSFTFLLAIRYFHGAIYICHWRRGFIIRKRSFISITSLFVKIARLQS